MWNLFQAIKRSWLKHSITQITAIFILTVTYTVSLFIVMSMVNVKNVFYIWGKVNEITIYLKKENKLTETEQIIASIKKRKFVKSVKFVSSEKSAEKFKNRFSRYTPEKIEAGKISSFFPSSLHITLTEPIQSESDVTQVKSFAANLKRKFPAIDEILYGQSWMAKFIKLLNGIEIFSWILVFVIFVASLFVSINVLKTVLFSRKEEIEILEFIGATSFWIYAPSVLNCCILSALAFVAAVLSNYGIYTLMNESLSGMFSSFVMEQAQFFSPQFIAVFFVLLLVSVFFTSLTGARHFSPSRRKNS